MLIASEPANPNPKIAAKAPIKYSRYLLMVAALRKYGAV
jgi:hypothetical protein